MAHIRTWFIIAVGLYMFCAGRGVAAGTDDEHADSARAYRVPLIRETVDVDGQLSERIWQNALRLTLDYEVQPGENIAPPVRTDVFIAYDKMHLYVAFLAHDPNASAIRARLTDRDNMYADDWVGIKLDTFNDKRRSYNFFSNPLGVQADAIESAEGGGDTWDAIWDSEGRVTDSGYIVEMAVPFRTMNFQRREGDQVWGVDVVRNYPRNVAHLMGLFPRDRSNNCYLCQAEKLIGFAGVEPGHNIEIDPTFSVLYSEEREDFPFGGFQERTRWYEPGITARWSFAQNARLHVTANPDFSHVEADAAQLDINNQFALYYREKRPFFYEDADYFITRILAVHTRTMVEPDWGIKITGSHAGNVFGAYVVRDNRTDLLLPGSQGYGTESLDEFNLASILRYRRDIGRGSAVGVLIADRESESYGSRLAGLDADVFLTSRDRLRTQVLFSQTDYPFEVMNSYGQLETDVDGGAVDLYYIHHTRSWDVFTTYREINDDFRADLGFVSQAGFRKSYSGAAYTWQNRPDHWYNLLHIGSGFTFTEETDGTPLEKGYVFWTDYRGPLESMLSFQLKHIERGYYGRSFDITYLYTYASLRPSGNILFMGSAMFGEEIDYYNVRVGNRTLLSPFIQLKLGQHLVCNIQHDYEQFIVDGDILYSAHINQARIIYQFDERMFLRTIVQYTDYNRNLDLYVDPWNTLLSPETESLFAQVLFSYKVNPQTVLYLGYSGIGYGDIAYPLTGYENVIFVKLGYAVIL
jgi:hypothetical protein